MAQIELYTLPEIQFVGGSSQTYYFNLATSSGVPYDALGCTVDFSIVHYSNKSSIPVLSKEATIMTDLEDISSIVSIELNPSDTSDLCGKYIYQITIKDIDGNADIPNQGIMYITRNINTGFLTESEGS
jgi:hypothetical protein